eukprot:evm.model.scf_81.15 EVM.evm.TU.scf_81.15   scf_81:153458-154252(+)
MSRCGSHRRPCCHAAVLDQGLVDRTKDWNNSVNISARKGQRATTGRKPNWKSGGPGGAAEGSKKRKRAETGPKSAAACSAAPSKAKAAKKSGKTAKSARPGIAGAANRSQKTDAASADARAKSGEKAAREQDGDAAVAQVVEGVVAEVVMAEAGMEIGAVSQAQAAGAVAPGKAGACGACGSTALAEGAGDGGYPACVFKNKTRFATGVSDREKVKAMGECIARMREAGLTLSRRLEALEAELREAREAAKGALAENGPGSREP